MSGSIGRRRPVTGTLALVAALAITAGWGAPGSSGAAGSSDAGGPAAARAAQEARSEAVAGGRRDADDVAIWLAFRVERAAAPTVGAGLVSSSRGQERTSAQRTRPAERAPLRVAMPEPGSFSGRNRFWMPALGMSFPVHYFECTRNREPDNLIYRWGCAGSNNVYILGHAWGVMEPLHDLYVSGGLRVGMVAMYADGSGRIRQYRVTEWRLMRPDEPAWSMASQPVPSMTLQTCVGDLRLKVRLIAVD